MGKKVSNVNEDTVFRKSNSDEETETSERVHNQLLDNIQNFHGKPKIKPPSRTGTSTEVSDLHLKTNTDQRKKRNTSAVILSLAKALGKPAAPLVQKIQSIQKKTKTLPKPLEKIHAQRLQRTVVFNNVKKDLDKWKGIVNHNRTAPQLKFPLKNEEIEIYHDTNYDILATYRTPTDLEQKMAEILNACPLYQKEKEKQEKRYKLKMAELIEKRNMTAKLRAQASYHIAKVVRQNKIKSKSYRRLVRRDRLKNQMKNFEELQKTDPEAALKQLEQLERNRAQERATLRHRNTGKWARNEIVKAKYNKESRIALSEQLQKNKELTRKRKLTPDVDSDGSEMSEEDEEVAKNDATGQNPKNEYERFVNDYMKYWENQKKEKVDNKENQPDTIEVVSSPAARSAQSDNMSSDSENVQDGNTSPILQENFPNDMPCKKSASKNKKKKRRKDNSLLHKEIVVTVIGVWEVTDLVRDDEGKDCDISNTNDKSDNINDKSKNSNGKNKNSNNEDKGTNYKSQDTHNKSNNANDKGKNSNSKSKISSDKGKHTKDKNKNGNGKSKDTNDKIKNKSANNKSKKKVNISNSNVEINSNDAATVVPSSLQTCDRLVEKKRSVVEDTHRKKSSRDNKKINDGGYQTIDPNSFITLKPKSKLQTAVPDFVNDGNELDDDDDGSMTLNSEQQLAISEAFADDNLVADFEEEKERLIKDSMPNEDDGILPGWGSWTGGKFTNENKKRKKRIIRPRFNKRLLFKIPAAPPRKDCNKGRVIINEDKNPKLRQHMVSELPYPFESVKDFEASIRAPVGRDWVPETAHQNLIAPPIVTKLGTVIEPMSSDILKNKSK